MPCNVRTIVSANNQHQRTQGAKNSASTRGYSFNVSSKSAAVRSRTSLAAATGEIIDNDAARRVSQVDLENMMTVS